MPFAITLFIHDKLLHPEVGSHKLLRERYHRASSRGTRPEGMGCRSTRTYRCGSVDSTILKEIEATLHCLMSIQEASPVEDNADLKQLFSSETLGSFPKTGSTRVRRTTVVLIGNSMHHLTCP